MVEVELQNGDYNNEYIDDMGQEEKSIETNTEVQAEDEGANESYDEVSISIEGEHQENHNEDVAPTGNSLIKDLRKKIKESNKKIKQMEEQLNNKEPLVDKLSQPLSAKPTLESCDYDDEVYSQRLENWHKQKISQELEEEKAKKVWEQRLTVYTQAKQSLKVSDFEEAEEVVIENLSEQQQGILLHGSDDPAMLVYALGKYPKKAKELASITDPVKYTFALAKLETQLKITTNKKTAPAPEKMAPSNGGVSKSPDGALSKLEAEAQKTGDYSKLFAYNRAKRRQN